MNPIALLQHIERTAFFAIADDLVVVADFPEGNASNSITGHMYFIVSGWA